MILSSRWSMSLSNIAHYSTRLTAVFNQWSAPHEHALGIFPTGISTVHTQP